MAEMCDFIDFDFASENDRCHIGLRDNDPETVRQSKSDRLLDLM